MASEDRFKAVSVCVSSLCIFANDGCIPSRLSANFTANGSFVSFRLREADWAAFSVLLSAASDFAIFARFCVSVR